MSRKANSWSFIWLFALGVGLALLLLVPQLSLYAAYSLVVWGALSLIAVLILLKYSTGLAIAFTICMSLLGYLLEMEEGVMLPFDIISSILALLIIRDARPGLWWRIVMACVIGTLVMIVGSACLPAFRKGMTILEALKYGGLHQWPVLLATLVGSLLGGWLGARKRLQT